MCECVCERKRERVCVSVCEREKERGEGGERARTLSVFQPPVVSVASVRFLRPALVFVLFTCVFATSSCRRRLAQMKKNFLCKDEHLKVVLLMTGGKGPIW